jgi:hypothetical protein
MMGAPLYFPAIFFINFLFLQRGFFGFFVPSVNSRKKNCKKKFPNFLCQEIEQKNPGGVPLATV